jgi:hypothetical protein
MHKIHRPVVGRRGDQTPAEGGDRSAEREPTSLPQTEVVVESTLEEATLVEGKCSSQLVVIMRSSRSC